MVANAVKTKESGNQKDGNNGRPKIFTDLAPGMFAWLVWVNGLTQGFASIKKSFAQFYPNCIDTGNWDGSGTPKNGIKGANMGPQINTDLNR